MALGVIVEGSQKWLSGQPRSAWESLRQGTGRQEQQAGTGTQAMNVDREDELRIQAPPRGSVSQ